MKKLDSRGKVGSCALSAIAIAAAAMMLSACGISTATYGTGKAPELAMFTELGASVPGLGSNKKGEQIDYKPRSPLVMPPQTDLAAPGAAPTVTASTAETDWPDDPDQRPDKVYSSAIDQAYLDRLKPYAKIKEPEPEVQPMLDEEGRISSKDFYRNQKNYNKFSGELAELKGVGKTERVYLTDPPEEYRIPADSAPTEFEEVDVQKKGGIRKWWANIRGGG